MILEAVQAEFWPVCGIYVLVFVWIEAMKDTAWNDTA